uniref:Uncharacterized protein n=1 Tax=Picocystis salinarum TaxID=88271 RepID=A0A7S3UGT4_9CHLO
MAWMVLLVKCHRRVVGREACGTDLFGHHSARTADVVLIRTTTWASGNVWEGEEEKVCDAAEGVEAEVESRWMDHVVDVLQNWTPWKRNEATTALDSQQNELQRMVDEQEIKYVYATHEAYLFMEFDLWKKHGIQVISVDVDANGKCFGSGEVERTALRWLNGEQVVLKNSVLHARKRGFFLNRKTMELSMINPPHAQGSVLNNPKLLSKVLSEKAMLIAQVLLIHATLTTSVGYVVGEIIKRMQNLMIHVRLRIFEERISFKMLAKYTSETLIFLPGIVGNLIFVAQFLPDGNLALVLQVLTILVEFSLAFLMQSKLSRTFIPRFFFLYVAAFLYYVLAYTAGYSWLACIVLVFAVVHLVMVFWNRCEQRASDPLEVSNSATSAFESFMQALQARSWAWIARVDRPLLGDLASVLFFWSPPVSTFTIGRISAVAPLSEEE